MKKLLLASVGLAVLGMASASAADLPRQMPVKAAAPAYAAPSTYNWTGPYIGINGGYAWGGGKDGGLVGGTLGYNYQTGPWVFGLEGDWDWTSIEGSTGCAAGTCTVKNHWLATTRGRIGYAMGTTGNILPYVTGGAAFGDIENSVSGVGTVSDTATGWTVGAGLEAEISGPLTAKVEYLYVDLDNGPTLAGQGSNLQNHIVRAGLNYRF